MTSPDQQGIDIKKEQAQVQAIDTAHQHVNTQLQNPQPSDSPTPKDLEFIQMLQAQGIPEQQIGQSLAMLHHNIPEEDILNVLQGASNG